MVCLVSRSVYTVNRNLTGEQEGLDPSMDLPGDSGVAYGSDVDGSRYRGFGQAATKSQDGLARLGMPPSPTMRPFACLS